MKTEDFDDAFRNKIDNVKQEDISDNEAQKIFNNVNKKRSSSNKKSYLLFGVSSIILAVIAGLLTLNIVQMRQKRNLENEINSFEKNKMLNLKNNNVAVERDTIYNKEYVQSANNLKKDEETKKIIESQNKLIAGLQNELNSIKETSLTKNTVIEYINKKNNILLLSDNSVATNDLIFEMLRSVDTTVELKKRLRNFSYQLGIGTHIADDQNSVSVLLGINLNRHWNISAGINRLVINNKNYNDNDDFHYSSQISDTSLMSILGIKQTIYQIPLTINYRISLPNKFSLLFGVGTDLDLYATNCLDYNIRVNSNEEKEKTVTTKSHILVFNNAVISVGLNKDWKYFSIQLSPFINPQITRVSYKTPESNYGGRIRLFHTF